MRFAKFFALLLVLLAGRAWAAGAPESMVGIRLGASVENIQSMLDESMHQPFLRQPGLHRVAINAPVGYRSGYITYGDCASSKQVVRIKLKYADESEDFYERVLKALRERYGRGEWRGDAFGTLRSWKWSFKNAAGESISLRIQRYTGEEDSFTFGNSIRLANRDAMRREFECGQASLQAETEKKTGQPPAADKPFSWYLPQ